MAGSSSLLDSPITQGILKVVEPMVFARRGVTLTVLGLITAFLGYHAAQIEPDAGYEKSIPLNHPYMSAFTEYYSEFGGANLVLVGLQQKEGEIYNERFLTLLKNITDEVFFLPNIDRPRVMSIFTPNTTYVEVTEQGFEGGNVIPSDYRPSPEAFAEIKANVAKAQVIGRLVSENEQGALIVSELLEVNPQTGEKIDYVEVANLLERIRDRIESPRMWEYRVKQDTEHHKAGEVVGTVYEQPGFLEKTFGEQVVTLPQTGGETRTVTYKNRNLELAEVENPEYWDNVNVHIIGFAKVVGDITDATLEVVGFFLLALVMTSLLLWGYLGSLRMAFLPMVCSIVAVIWEFGLLSLFGFGLDPFAILVPFLVLAVSVSHGVQYVNAWVSEVGSGMNSFDASVETFRRLAIPGTVALITDVAGFATIALIDIQIIQEMSANAAFGVAAIIITNKILMPAWLTYMKVSDPVAFEGKQKKREALLEPIWAQIAKIVRPVPAATAIVVGLVCLGWAFWMYPNLQVGDALEGTPELRPDSRFNVDARAIGANFSIGIDIMKVIAETTPDGCVEFEVVEEIDRFAWRMDNVEGVASTLSMLDFAKLVYRGLNEARPSAEILPRNQRSLAQATALVPSTSGLVNADCSAMAVFIFTEDHKAETIKRIVAETKQYEEETSDTDFVSFRLATGNVGVMAATNEVVEEQELMVVFWVYVVVISFIFLSFRNISSVLSIVLPLSLVSMMAYGVMAGLGIGLKVATLPVVALAVGIGVDYGIYIYATLEEGVNRGLSFEQALRETLRSTGKAVVFTGVALGLSVATWLWSELQFQADMGILLVFMFTANMFGAILLLPAIARFTLKPPKQAE